MPETLERINWNRLIICEHNREVLIEKFGLPENATWTDISKHYIERSGVANAKACYSVTESSKGVMMPSKIDQRRLNDGAIASSLSEPTTIQEIEEQIETISDGIRALQSLDDLGSAEANKAAWNQMLEL